MVGLRAQVSSLAEKTEASSSKLCVHIEKNAGCKTIYWAAFREDMSD